MIKRFIERFFEEDYAPQPMDTALAAAVLLMEVTRADHTIDPAEEAAMRSAIGELLPDQDAQPLLDDALSTSMTANDLQKFTSAIHEQWNTEQKTALMIALWKTAFADGNLDKYEEHIIRRIAELLYLPHSEFIRTKLLARDH